VTITYDEKKSDRSVIGLDLALTDITDSGLSNLKDLSKLQKLIFCQCDISDAAMVHLKELTNLHHLNLESTNITDVGLVNIKGLTYLKHLNVRGTKVTKAGIEKLQASIPNCKIEWDGK